MIKIFISYRREDSANVTGRINDRLRDKFGEGAIFTDVDSIPFGVDFREHLNNEVTQCDIVLAVIGRDWLDVTGDDGRRRLDDAADFVRIEIESALARDIPVIPLLADGVAMPSADQLPQSLRALAFRNGTQVRPDPDFHRDIDRLIDGLERFFTARDKPSPMNSTADADRSNVAAVADPSPAERDEQQGRETTRRETSSPPSRMRFFAIGLVLIGLLGAGGWFYVDRLEQQSVAAAEQKRLATEEAERLADAAEKRQIAEEAERKRLAAEQKQIAEEAERKRLAAEQKQIAEEAQRKRLAAEQKQIADEAERKRLAAEQKRIAEEAQRKRLAAEQKQIADEAERKRLAEEARSKPGSIFRDPLASGGEGPQMVAIPAGTFQMGSPAGETGRESDEGPLHRVTVAAFALGRYEVTFAEYLLFAQATGRAQPSDKGWGGGRRPVINVSWTDAQGYATWLSKETGQTYRLPSEAEWEYAARAGTTTANWWGDDIQRGTEVMANCDGCGSEWDLTKTAPVGQFAANAFGLHDMHGNVWEWTQDCWHGSYVGAPKDGAAWEATEGGDCTFRVVRGGSWFGEPAWVRSAFRNRLNPGSRNLGYGFRLARTL
jgi:formylglycine-generating enzyme required for sulfatase activity